MLQLAVANAAGQRTRRTAEVVLATESFMVEYVSKLGLKDLVYQVNSCVFVVVE